MIDEYSQRTISIFDYGDQTVPRLRIVCKGRSIGAWLGR